MPTELVRAAVAVVASLTMALLNLMRLRRFGEEPATRRIDFAL